MRNHPGFSVIGGFRGETNRTVKSAHTGLRGISVPLTCAHHELTGRRCQSSSTVWIFPFTGVGGVVKMI
jgi:hypothetical protein